MIPIRWGILATGEVAKNFTQALKTCSDAQISAVSSRTQGRAEDFGNRWNIPVRYGSYQALAEDPRVDIIYIATPHNLHAENIEMCLKAGKHVLCEKAFTLNARQAEVCIALAREKNLFLMEAMWMRFFPAAAQIRDWLAQGILGQIRLVQADFCINLPFDPDHRLYDLERAGGALLDLGIYPLSFASMVLGPARRVHGRAQIGQSGVDELDAITLSYDQGAFASLNCGMRGYKPREAFIIGSEGYVKVHNIFFRPDRLSLHLIGQDPEDFHFPIEGNGYQYEIQEVHRCLQSGQIESHMMPLDESLSLMKQMDELRSAWNLVYPDER